MRLQLPLEGLDRCVPAHCNNTQKTTAAYVLIVTTPATHQLCVRASAFFAAASPSHAAAEPASCESAAEKAAAASRAWPMANRAVPRRVWALALPGSSFTAWSAQQEGILAQRAVLHSKV